MNTGIKINNHPFYQDSRFETEKKILEKLTEICKWDTTVGVLDFYHDVPSLNIGIVNEKETSKRKIPIFEVNTTLTIALSSKDQPVQLSSDMPFHVLNKIVTPLLINWIEIATFLISFYEGDLAKELCEENLRYWKSL